jgi:hypothetical protein
MQKQTYITPEKHILVKEWQKSFGHPAPSGCHPSLLDKAIAWQRQANKQGGLISAERRQLLGEMSSGSVGMRLMSERVWCVSGKVKPIKSRCWPMADGYLYAEQRWKSLSAIAKAITGTPWSGPVFFGLKK